YPSSLVQNLINTQAGEILAMPAHPAVVGALPVLEDVDLLVAALFDNRDFDPRAFDDWLADDGVITITDQQNITDFKAVVDLIREAFDINGRPNFGAKL